MFKTEVTLLKKENQEQLMELDIEEALVIKDIMKGISIFKVNSYDAQVIQRDLIGMAQELKLRGSNLKEAIGEDLKGFTKEIVLNSSGPCIKELFLSFLSQIFKFYIWASLLSSGFLFSSTIWKVNPSILVIYPLVAIIAFIGEGLIAPFFITEKGFKKNLYLIVSIGIFLAVIIILNPMIDKGYVKEINGGLLLAVSILAFQVLQFINKLNIKRLSNGKKNYIQDLL